MFQAGLSLENSLSKSHVVSAPVPEHVFRGACVSSHLPFRSPWGGFWQGPAQSLQFSRWPCRIPRVSGVRGYLWAQAPCPCLVFKEHIVNFLSPAKISSQNPPGRALIPPSSKAANNSWECSLCNTLQQPPWDQKPKEASGDTSNWHCFLFSLKNNVIS